MHDYELLSLDRTVEGPLHHRRRRFTARVLVYPPGEPLGAAAVAVLQAEAGFSPLGYGGPDTIHHTLESADEAGTLFTVTWTCYGSCD